MTTKLYPYQKEGVELIEHFSGRVLLADEQGLGKTLQVLWWLRMHPEVRPVVVVCPASVKYVWEEQAREHCGLRVTLCSGQKPPKKQLVTGRDIFVINYDILFYWAIYLRKLHPRVVIFDEVHKLKSRATWRTRAARKLCSPIRRLDVCQLAMRDTHDLPKNGFSEDDEVEFIDGEETITGFITKVSDGYATVKTQIPHLMGLSGTPLLNRPEELWTTLNLIWPQYFPAFTPFGWEFCDAEKGPYGWTFKGATNLPKLHRMLTRLGMIRRRKKDVLKDLPSKQRIVVPIEIDNQEEYEQARDDFLNWLARQDAARAERASKAEEMSRMSYLKRIAAQGKLAGVREWIDNFLEDAEDKLVVGAWHHEIINPLHEHYRKNSVTFTGKTNPRLRGQVVQQFKHHGDIRIIFGNIQAIGTGVDGLQATSHTSAVIELPWDPGTLAQYDDRIHRIGQRQAVTIYYLVAKGTIEESLCRIIQDKQDILTRTLDGEENVEQMKLDIFDKLRQELKKETKR